MVLRMRQARVEELRQLAAEGPKCRAPPQKADNTKSKRQRTLDLLAGVADSDDSEDEDEEADEYAEEIEGSVVELGSSDEEEEQEAEQSDVVDLADSDDEEEEEVQGGSEEDGEEAEEVDEYELYVGGGFDSGLRALTPRQESLYNAVMNGPDLEVVAKHPISKEELLRKDFRRVMPGEWLSDEVLIWLTIPPPNNVAT